MTRLFGLIGHPLGHSWSAEMFGRKFAAEGIDARYDLYPLSSISEFLPLVGDRPSLAGLNVTIPYKREVIQLLDTLTPEAEEAGAVNAVRIVRGTDGAVIRLDGHNTDIAGFSKSVGPLLEDFAGAERKALVLGTGGASAAVCVGLRNLGWTPVLVSRRPAEGVMTYSDLTPEAVTAHRLVVNTTPAGMFPKTDTAPPFPFEYLSSRHLCFDLIYNPEETIFMRIARAHGCRVKGGIEMLRLQAEAAWTFWNS